MDNDFKRLEEKQKLANLQIDKRLSEIENSLEGLKTEFGSISSEMDGIKSQKKKEIEEIMALTNSFDSNPLSKDVEQLKKSFEEFRNIVGSGNSSKLKDFETDLAHLFYDMKNLKLIIDEIKVRLFNLERNIKKNPFPVVIE